MKKWLIFKKIIFIFFCLGITFPVLIYTIYTILWFNFSSSNILAHDWSKLINSDLEKYKVLQYIKDKVPPTALCLVFRQAEVAYYTGKKFIRHLDPRLIGFYELHDKNKAYHFLINLGIDYIYTVSYMLPTYYNSQIYHITADPRLCELLIEAGGYRLFKLYKKPRNVQLFPLLNIQNANFFKKNNPWTIYSNKEKYSTNNWTRLIDETGESVLIITNKGKTKTYLYSGVGPLYLPPSNCFYEAKIEPNTIYHFEATVKGTGMFCVFLVEYSNDGTYIWIPIWKSVLNDYYQKIESQFMTSPEAQEYRIVLLLKEYGKLFLKNISIQKVEINNNQYTKKIKKIKKKKWIPILNVDFEKTKVDNSQKINFTVFPTIYWWEPMTSESHSGRYAIHLKRAGWLFTEYKKPGLYLLWKSKLQAELHKICCAKKSKRRKILLRLNNSICQLNSDFQTLSYRLSVFVKGKGLVDLFIWFDLKNKEKCLYLGRFYLPTEYKLLRKTFKLPIKAQNIRIAFRLINFYNETLYVDDLRLEKEIIEEIAPL